MKKIFTLFLAVTAAYGAFAQTYYSWDLTTSATFPAGFVTWNLDSQTVDPSLINALPGITANDGWIIDNADFQNDVPMSISYFTNSSVQCDRWLVTAKMNVPSGVPYVGLVWYAQSLGPVVGITDLDDYQILVSTTDSNTTSFTDTLLTITGESGAGSHVLPLSRYAGQTIRVAFRNISTNKVGLILTTIKLINLPKDAAKVTDVEIYEHNYLNHPVTVTGIMKNTGLDTINSFTLNYSVNGAAAVTSAQTNMGYLPQNSFLYTHSTAFNPSTAGTYTVSVWFSGINGTAVNSDTASTTIFFYPLVAGLKKNVLVEEFTGAWCGYCPGGAFQMRDLLQNVPNTIGVAIHDRGGRSAISDLMQIPAGDQVSNALNDVGFPSAMVDRQYFFDNQATALGFNGYTGVDNNAVQDTAARFRLVQATPVNVSLANKTYDSISGDLTIDVNATFLNSLSQGDYRVNLFVVEDSVIKAGAGYNQVNYYAPAYGYEDGLSPLNNFPATITNDGLTGHWSQNHVLRAMAGGAWGTQSIIPSAPVAGTTYTNTYSLTLDSNWRSHFLSVIAVVQEYNTSVKKRTILNATEAYLTDDHATITGIKATEQFNKLQVYPNPSSTMATVEMDIKESATVNLVVVNTLGEPMGEATSILLNAGIHTVKLPVSNLADGLYFVKIISNGQTNSLPLSVIK